MNNGTRGLGTPPPGPGRKSPCLLVSAVWTRRNPSPEPAAGVSILHPLDYQTGTDISVLPVSSVHLLNSSMFYVSVILLKILTLNVNIPVSVSTVFNSIYYIYMYTLHLLHVFYCLQNRKQHLATSRQQIGVQRLLIRNLKVLLCCWCCDHGVPAPASSLGLSSPSLRSPSLNIPRPPTLNFPNLKSISVWKSTINFIFPRYIMPHFFCQYKRKRKCLLN